MKNFFTLAIVAMIASLSFGQTIMPVAMAERKSKIQKEALVSPSTTRNNIAPKAAPIEFVATSASAQYYASDGAWFVVLTNGSTAFRFNVVTNSPAPLEFGHTYTLADMDAIYSWYGPNASDAIDYSAATLTPKQGNTGTDYEATVTLTNGTSYHITYIDVPKEPVEVVATRASEKYYEEINGSWFVLLWDDDMSFMFRFDIVTNDSAPLELGHTYTLADMDANYSWYGLNAQNSIGYKAATLTPKQGTYGIDYEATVTLINGDIYHITYTATPPKTNGLKVLSVQSQYYRNIWYFTFKTKDYDFYFVITNQDESGIEMDKVYTLDDMDAQASCFHKLKNQYIYYFKSVSFKATEGANGIDYTVIVVDSFDETYNLTYTAPASPEPSKIVEVEFTKAETNFIDFRWYGTIQFNGTKEDGFKAYVSFFTFKDVAGNYTYPDIFVEKTILFLDADDEEGLKCYDLTATVTEYEGDVYKAVVNFYGRDGILYKLTFNYGDTPISAINDITNEAGPKAYKTIENGQVVIVKGDARYNIMGQPVK